jgi:dihydroorotase
MLLLKNLQTLPKYIGKESSELIPICLIIKSGKIVQIQESIPDDLTEIHEIIDGQNLFVAPGFIDPQVHFREPGGEYKETLESGGKAAARGGFTTVITMPNTNPTTDNPVVLKQIIDKSKQLGLVRVLPTASVTKNLLGLELTDFSALKEAGAVALTDDGKGIQSPEVMKLAMQRAAEVGLAILDHSEDESLSNKGSIHEGAISLKFGVPGIKSESESVHVKRGCEYSMQTGCHFHVLHVSTKNSLKYVRQAKANGANVTCEVSPHHLLLCDEDIKTREDGTLDSNFKMNPPLRGKEDRQACIDAFLDGTIDFVATDHAPHSPQEKARHITEAPFGIVGVETAFELLYTHFVKTDKMSLERLIDMMTINAAKVFNLPYGDIKEGGSADLVIIDLEKSETIDSNTFLSKGKNTPFNDWECFGIPMLTIFNGKVVYRNGEF